MAIHYKNPQTGQYEVIKIPVMKGDTGHSGIHVGAEAPATTDVKLWFDPSDTDNDVDLANRLDTTLTACVDYMGNDRGSIKKAADANVDWILGEVNTAHYEGQHITATDTIEGRSKSVILSGQTLVNLTKAVFGNGRINKQYGNTASIKIELLKPSTKYIAYVFNDGEEDVELYWNSSANFQWKTFICKSKAVSYSIGTSKVNFNDNELVFSVQTTQTLPQSLRCVILEYQDGMENWDIPYFEGMQSVRMPVLTTTGKNLYPDGDLTINNPRTSVWYYTNGVGSKFGQHCKRGDGGNWFYLAKGTYTYKATTKNTLTNIVLIGEGEIVCTSGSTLESGWYAFRFKTGSESVDYAKVSNIQIELGSTATSYESHKSNILTTTGKNLFDMNRPYDVITDSQATVVQNTDQITVSSSESGTYVNANFILDKDFFAGKTVTGSCLYESDEKDIGTVQIAYQDGNGEHHYQWIKTPRTFTFPNSFIGDVMLSVSANNTGTPQSNTVTVKNIQLELGSTATSYEPYSEEVTLRGIGEVKDELNLLTGEVVERIGEIVLDGSENWNFSSPLSDTTAMFSLNRIINTLSRNSNSFITDSVYPNLDVYGSERDYEGIELSTTNPRAIFIKVKKSSLNGWDESLSSVQKADLFKSLLTKKPITMQYQLATESIKTVDLSDNVVYSYKDTTHYTCSSEDGSLIPTLSIDVPTNLPALVSKQRELIVALEQENQSLVDELEQAIITSEFNDNELLAQSFEMDFRLMEIEFALDLPMASTFQLGGNKMAMTPYAMAKKLILAGNYERADMERKLNSYVSKKRMTEKEREELIRLMDEQEGVVTVEPEAPEVEEVPEVEETEPTHEAVTLPAFE